LTKAAELNFVTRSAISQSIVRLEEWAGKQLTTHQKKNFELTAEGEEFFRHMKTSYLSFKKGIEHPQTHRSLKIGCSASVAEHFLIPKLKKMKKLDALQLVSGTSKHLEHLLSEEEIHLSLSIKEEKVRENEKAIHQGQFVLVSKDGKLKERVITTELRPEVTSLKRYFLERKETVTFLSVESWSLAMKLALDMDYACLLPDFLLGNGLKKISTRNFNHPYQVVIESLSPEKLSSLEIRLLKYF
jgi:DNA-binding transcriptional LysR family regulator